MAFKDRIKKALQQGKKEVQAPPTTAESFKQFLATKQQSEPKIFNNATNWMMNSAINQRNANRTARQTATQNVRNAERTVQPVASTKSDLTGNTTVRQNTQISDEEMKKMFKKANPNATDVELDTYVRNAKANGKQLPTQQANSGIQGNKQSLPENIKETGQVIGTEKKSTLAKLGDDTTQIGSIVEGSLKKLPDSLLEGASVVEEQIARNASKEIQSRADRGKTLPGLQAEIDKRSEPEMIARREAINNFTQQLADATRDKAENGGYIRSFKDASGITRLGEQAKTDIELSQGNLKTAVGQKIGELTPSLVQNGINMALTAINPALGTASFNLGALGDYYEEGLEKGMNKEQAVGYALTMTPLETISEQVIVLDNVGFLKGMEHAPGFRNFAGQLIKGTVENYGQEAVMEPLSKMAENANTDKNILEDVFSKEVLEQAHKAGVNGALTNLILFGSSAGLTKCASVETKITNKETLNADEVKEAVQELKDNGVDVDSVVAGTVLETATNLAQAQNGRGSVQRNLTQQTLPISEQFKQVLQGRNAQDVIQENMSLSEQVAQPVQRAVDLVNDTLESTVQANAQYFKSDADRNKFLNYGKGIQAITEQAGNPVKVLLDTTVGGDGLITINNADGTRAILVNPSMNNQSMEETLVHELFHNVKNTDEFKQIGDTLDNFVKKFKIKDSQGNLITLDNAKKQLQERYENYYKTHGLDTSTLDIDEESHAFLLQKIIGDEKTLNNLTKQQPKIVQAIYDFVDRISMRLKGLDKETANTIIDLRNKLGNALKNNGIEVADTIKNAVSQDITNKTQQHKEQQLEIIQETNPMFNDTSVGIRKVEDIKTFKECVENAEEDSAFVWGDYSKEDAERDLKRGKVTIYSSYPIKNGTFVSTSYQQAYEYAGHDPSKVHQRTVNLDSVAWINGDEGQYAKVKPKVDEVKQENKLIDRLAENLIVQNKLSENDIYDEARKQANREFKQVNTDEEIDALNNRISEIEKKITDAINNKQTTTTDNQGRTLSKQQQEFFKDSKVRDENGNLLTVYHGTEANAGIPQEYWFSIFDEGKQGNNGSWFGNGFYFTTELEHAKEYAHSKGNVYETYLNITNPYRPYQNGNSMLSFQEDFKNNFEEAKNIDGDLTGKQIQNILKQNGYDGIIIGDNIIAFNSNQIKNIDNTNPTNNPDIRYSISENTPTQDNQGRELSKGQQEFFKDSKVKDENGNLLEVYHSTPTYGFNIFDAEKLSRSPRLSQWGKGFYFTDNEMASADYRLSETGWSDNSGTYKTYLNITNPLILNNSVKATHTLDRAKLTQLLLEGNNDYFFDKWIPFEIAQKDLNNGETFTKEQLQKMSREEKVEKYLQYNFDKGYTGDQNILSEMLRAYNTNTELIDNFSKIFNVDGIIIKGGRANQYIAFSSNQIKNVDNTNPTDNPDIRYSQNTKNNNIWNNFLDQVDKQTGEKNRTYFKQGETKAKLPVNARYSVSADDYKQQANDLIDKANIPDKDKTSFKDSIKNIEITEQMIPELKDTLKIMEENTTEKLPTRNPKQDLGYFKKNSNDNLLEQIDQEVTEQKAKEQAKKEAKEKGETRPKLPANKISENNFKKQVEENKASKYKGKAERYYIRAKNNFINGITDRLDISKGSNKQLLNETIDKIENAVREQGEITSQERDTLFDEMFNNLIKIDDEYYNQYKDLKDDIAKEKILVDEQTVKNLASSYDSYNNFRKANFGNLNLSTKEGTSIDRIYQELSSAYGNLFPDNIYNPSEQLEYIADVVKDIRKSEMNLSSYDDNVLGGELRQYARQEFDGFVDDLINEYNRTERYKEDRRQSEIDRKKQTKSSTEETKSKYSQLPELKRQYEKASSNELLTDRDRIELDRLFKGEITLDDINPGLNRKGIEKVYKAGKKYKQLTQQLNTDRANIKKGYLSKANDIIGDLSQWKDKGQGIRYTRETAVRNFLDIAPKDIAERINDEYIYKYGENEANRTRFINEQTQKVKDLKLSNKKKYNATFDIQERDSNGNLVDKKTTRKVSEAELVQIYGEHRMSRDDLINTGVDVNKIDNAVNTFRNIYNEMLDMTNNVLIETGHAPIPKREDYFPHFEEGQDTTLQKVGKVLGIDLTGKELPTNIAGQTQNFKPDKTWVGNFLERKTNITDFNVLKGFDRYINGVSDVIYHTEDIMKMRGLETAVRQFYADDKIKERIQRVLENPDLTEDERYEEVRLITNQTLDKAHLSNFINWYGDYVNSLAGKKTISDRGIEKELSRKHYQAINKIQSRYSANAIGGNVSVALTNLGVIASASGETNPIFLIKGAYDTAKNSVKSIFGKGDDSLVSMSDFLTNRRGVDTAYTSMLDKATMPINAFINSFDNLSTEIVVRSKYLQNLHEGMTQYEALENADNFARGLISDRSKGMLPTQFNKTNPVAKLMNAFQVEANNQISYLVKDLNRNIRDKAERQGWSKSKTAVKLTEAYTGLFVGNFLINSLLSSVRGNNTRVLIDPIYMLSELVKGLIDDDEDNDKETVQNVFEEIIGQLPFVQVPVALFGDAFGLDSERIGRVPIAGAVPNVSNAVKSWTYTDKEGNKHISDARYILQENWKELQKPLLNLALPYGGMQLKKTANAIDTMVKGEKTKVDAEGKESIKYITYDKSILNNLKAVMLGDTARSEYQEYAENGYKGLNAKQTELYRNSKIPYRALLDYTKTKFESDKDENGKVIKNSLRNKKIDYIEGMDISDEQKIDMYKYDVFSKEQMETGEKIQEEGGNANAYYNYLRGTIKMESEKDKNGDAIAGSLKAKKVEWILNSDLSREDKNNIIREEFSTDKTKASISDYNKINKDYDTLLYYNNLQEDAKKEFKEIAKAGVDQKKYIDYKEKVSKLTKQGKKTASKDDDINNAKKCKLLRQSGLSNKDKATIYEMDLGKKDTTYQQLKSTKVKIDEYLKYKEANLKADRVDDGTVDGKAVSGSLKAKKVEFINNMNITYEQKLLLMGKDYKLSTQERSYIANYINGLNMTRKEKLDLYGSLKGFTVYKDGRVTW